MRKQKQIQRLMATTLSICLALGMLSFSAAAEDAGGEITAFEALEETVRWQRTATPDFPESLAGTVDGETVKISVTWDAGCDFDADYPEKGLYVFTAQPDGHYALGNGVEAPRITVYIPTTASKTPMLLLSGTGTSGDPVIITTAEQLREIAELVNNENLENFLLGDQNATAYLELGNSIDLSNYGASWNGGKGWIPIGESYICPFKSVFDGGGCEISGLYIQDTSLDYAGLFGYLEGGRVEGLSVTGAEIEANEDVGGIAGDARSDSTIQNCHVTGKISGNKHVGGIAGYVSSGTIQNCDSASEVSGSNEYIGGIAGSVTDGVHGSKIQNCYSTGEISGINRVGGIAGALSDSDISNCYATGKISGNGYLGGIAGTLTWGSIDNCYATGEVSGRTLDNNGAFAGMLVRGKTVSDNDGTQPNGEKLSAGSIQADGTLGGRFTVAEGWTVENGRLPGLGSTVEIPAHILGFNLSVSGTHTFTAATVGYSPVSPLSVTVSNIGNQATGTLTVELAGTDFTLSTDTIAGIAAGNTDSFTIAPQDGLTAGAFSDTVTVSGENGITASFNISFTVNAAPGPSGGNSGGGSSDKHDSPATTIIITSGKKPDQPITALTEVPAASGPDGTAGATIPDKTIADAIAKAQAEANKQGKTENGVAIALNITSPGGITAQSVTLSPASLKALADADVSSLEINGLSVGIGFDLKALQAIRSQSGGNVTITATIGQNLSDEAKALIGPRPVYNIKIGYGSDSTVTELGGGTATVSIPYTPTSGEAVGYLYAVHVDGNGNTTRIDDSVYDSTRGCLIITTRHFSIYGVGYTSPGAKFTDISHHWAADNIDYVLGRELFSGTSNTTFSPDKAMSRGMLVSVLGRQAGAGVSSYTTGSFTDVATDKYYMPYIEWAYKKGIIQGIGDYRFAPERTVTREEIAVIFANYAKSTDYTLPVTWEANAYADSFSIGCYYKEAVTAMQQAGIMLGGAGSKFYPKSGATRAEVSTMLSRYIKLTIDPDTAAQGWALNDAGQWLYCTDGKALTEEQTINGVKYFFSSTGTLRTGWVLDGDDWRFYKKNQMLTGFWSIGAGDLQKTYYFTMGGLMASDKWLQIGDKWYYFYADGSLAKSTAIDGYEVDEDGARKSE